MIPELLEMNDGDLAAKLGSNYWPGEDAQPALAARTTHRSEIGKIDEYGARR